MAATVSRTTATADGTLRRGAPRYDRPPTIRADGLFAEDRFEWPEPPGDAKKEAKLPLFRFHDADEARAFLVLFTINNVVGLVGCLNLVLGNHKVIGTICLLVGIVSNIVYLRLWIRLCKRAHPLVAKKHWWTSGVFNIVSWQALSQASAVVRQR